MSELSTPSEASGVRRAVQARSALLLVFFAGRPKWQVALVPIAAIVGLLFARGPVALLPGLVLIAVVGLLSYLSWPVVSPGARTGRLLILAVLTAVVVVQISR